MTSSVPPEYQPSHPLSRNDGRLADWLQSNARVVGGLGVVAVLGLGGALVWRSVRASAAARAERAFVQAQDPGGAATPAQREERLRRVATQYGGTAGGAQATLLAVQALYDQGRWQDGLTLMQRADLPDDFRNGARLLEAAGREGIGRPAEAARIYEELARDEAIAATRRGELQASAARAYQLAGDRAAALRIWQKLASEATGALLDEARVRAGELGAAA